MFARVQVDLTQESFLTVPREAILVIEGNEYVYVMDGEGRYARRAVQVAAPAGDGLALVLEGLADGEQIVTKGAVFLKALETPG